MFGAEPDIPRGVGNAVTAAANGDGEPGSPSPDSDFTADTVLEAPALLLGSIEEMADTLRARRERWGISYITLQGPGALELEPLVATLAGT